MKRACLVVLAAGCLRFTGPTVLRWVPASLQAKEAVEPLLPRRDHCLKPPFALATDAPQVLGAMRVEPRSVGTARELTFSPPGGAAVTADALLAFHGRVQGQLRAMPGVESTGLSGCPGRAGNVPCIMVNVTLCQETLEQLSKAFAGLVEADTDVRGKQVVFHVKLDGPAGPRCEAQDPLCRPQPYESAEYRRRDERGLIHAVEADAAPECRWDGECSKSGCGNGCVSWTSSHLPGTCEYREELRGALCGCVTGHCAWFVQ